MTNAASSAVKTGREDDRVDLDDEVVDDGLEDVINVSGQFAKFNIDSPKIITLKPGQYTRIPKEYTIPVKGAGGDTADSLDPVIMRLTGGRVVPCTHPSARTHKKYRAPKKTESDE